jgi:uncharacterized membrane protein
MKELSLYIMSLLYVSAGINHFWHCGVYMKIMPPWIGWHKELVYISGVFEIVLGILLVFPQTRVMAAWGIILLLIAVFPANIQMTINYINQSGPRLWVSVIRLPLQIVLIWWAFVFTRN